jgi:hypothetical protein
MVITEEMKAAGWIEHHGGKCPVNGMSFPEVMLRNGAIRASLALHFNWERRLRGDDIVAYRPEQPEPERKAA